jgi:uncharacterized protein YrrD
MRYVKGSEVFNATGEKVGTLDRVVIDPRTNEVINLIVGKGILFREDKVIPVTLVDVANEEQIKLKETHQDIEKDFPNFEESHYITLDPSEAVEQPVDAIYWYPPASYGWPVGAYPGYYMPPRYVLKTERNIPEGSVALEEGARVVSRDEKHIGNVEQLIAEPEDNRITHFVVGEGFLLKAHKLVPAYWISKVEEDQIQLSVDAQLFERLPEYQPER